MINGNSTISEMLCRLTGTHSAPAGAAPTLRHGDRTSVRWAGNFRKTTTALALVLAVFFTLSVGTANAQLDTAQVSGTVHDQTGALVPGAQVDAIHRATGVVT